MHFIISMFYLDYTQHVQIIGLRNEEVRRRGNELQYKFQF